MSCISEELIEEADEIPTAEIADSLDGDDGEGPPVERARMAEQQSSFSENSPCGEQTVDMLSLENAQFLSGGSLSP